MKEAYLFPKNPLPWDSTNRAHSFIPQQMTHAEAREYLRVTTNPRYRPALPLTYCNVAAHDFATLRGHYIPRVWWKNPAKDDQVIYGETVREMSANSLFDWFYDFGTNFNWVKVYGWKVAQEIVNTGGMAVIVAKRKDRAQPGHITVINPVPLAVTDKVPSQWQAGKICSENLQTNWYTSTKYVDFAIWATEGKRD